MSVLRALRFVQRSDIRDFRGEGDRRPRVSTRSTALRPPAPFSPPAEQCAPLLLRGDALERVEQRALDRRQLVRIVRPQEIPFRMSSQRTIGTQRPPRQRVLNAYPTRTQRGVQQLLWPQGIPAFARAAGGPLQGVRRRKSAKSALLI